MKRLKGLYEFLRAFSTSLLSRRMSSLPLPIPQAPSSNSTVPTLMRFAMLVERQPLSINATKPTPFVNHVKALATTAYGARQQMTGDLYARVVWFHRDKATTDADNIPKRLLDGLRSVVFKDDFLVSKCLAQRVSLSTSYQLDTAALEQSVFPLLLAAIGNPAKKHVVYLEVGQRGGSDVRFGPVEE